MKLFTTARFGAVILALTLSASCSNNDLKETDPLQGLSKIAEGYAAGAAAKVEIWAASGTIKTGYTPLIINLIDSVSGKRIEDAHIHLTPMMDMGMMQHSAPFENPEEEPVNHVFPCSATFIMPSTAGNWTLNVAVHNHLVDKEGDVTFPLTVTETAKPTIKSFTSAADGSKIFVALVNPMHPKVGVNELELVVYTKASMMSFPADSSLTIKCTPEMPSMGHGSPNNVDPVHVTNGHYTGKVNFTMTGAWRLNLDFYKGAAVADTTQYIDIEF